MMMTPSTLLGDHLSRLRRRHTIGRVLYVITLALAADLSLDLINVSLYILFRWTVPMPFFFEVVLTVLLVRELPGLRAERFALQLDRRFSLKDRLYSFIEYGARRDLSPGLRNAQAVETLAAIDFGRIRSGTRVRPPAAMFILLPIALFMVWLGWNAGYPPPGITNRILQKIIQPDSARVDLRPDIQKENRMAGDPDDSSGPNASLSEDEETNNRERSATQPDEGNKGSEGATGNENARDSANGGPGGQNAGSGAGIGSGGHAEIAVPEIIQSIPVTREVSLPVPPTLAEEAADSFRSFPEARNYLSLIPGQRGKEIADLEPDIIENFRNGLKNVPKIYHEQLNAYYEELDKWAKHQVGK